MKYLFTYVLFHIKLKKNDIVNLIRIFDKMSVICTMSLTHNNAKYIFQKEGSFL